MTARTVMQKTTSRISKDFLCIHPSNQSVQHAINGLRQKIISSLLLTLKDMQRRDEVLLNALVKNRIPVAVLYGGGYNREHEYTAKIHRNTVATAKKIARQFRGI